jgi:hypothetical protein
MRTWASETSREDSERRLVVMLPSIATPVPRSATDSGSRERPGIRSLQPVQRLTRRLRCLSG